MIFIALLIAALIAFFAGMGITFVIGFALEGWAFWLAIGGYLAFLVLSVAGGIMFRIRALAIFNLLWLIGAVVPLAAGWI